MAEQVIKIYVTIILIIFKIIEIGKLAYLWSGYGCKKKNGPLYRLSITYLQNIEEILQRKQKSAASDIKVDSRDFVIYHSKCIKGKLMKRIEEVD